ncbi:MAG: DUF4435 domain-containing protein [Bacteroidales bacterium]|nr:DUF4435 domain-containing protein [Bacteroidales bacterium]
MATLIEALTPRYSQQASVLTGNPNRVTVEVEDNIDAEFWGDILREQCPEKDFHFNPYQTILKDKGYVEATGKSRIIKMADSLNSYHIGCVDSDYDWLFSDTLEYGKTICSTPYLLQTYTYSIENLMCNPETLSTLVQYSCQEDTEYDFVSYFESLSAIIYPLLIWSLYLKEQGSQDFTPGDWSEILLHDSSDLDAMTIIVSKKIKELEENHADETDMVNALEGKMQGNMNVNESTAYQYVQGHALFNHVHRAVLKPIVESLSKKHIDSLSDNSEKASYSRNIKQNRIDILLSHNYSYKSYSNLYKDICNDIKAIWNK